MADHYTEFSEAIENLTIEEADWLDRQLASDATADCPVFLTDYPNRDPYDTDCGFGYSFEEHGGRRWLWIGSSEGCNVDYVAHLVQKFLRQFRPDQCWSLTYAVTCSKPRVGEFGGGAVFVTADEINDHNAYAFVEQQQAAFQKKRQKQQKQQQQQTQP